MIARAHAPVVRGAAAAALLALGLGSPDAAAQTAPPPSAAPSATPPVGAIKSTCVEHLPAGATRPGMTDELPRDGLSGHAVELVVTLEHGRGETVLPGGFELQRGSDAAVALERAGFELPDPAGPAAPRIETAESAGGVVTTVHVPLLLLPDAPGRQLLRLPPLPIAVARASGERMTLCTRPHDILVEDPTANESKPAPRPNPEPRPQREPWEELKLAVLAIVIGLVLGTIMTWLLRRWARRPRRIAAPAPVLPWIAALQELDAIRRSGRLVEGHTVESFDQISDTVRKYLGARYGFDGLETTTHEMRSLLRRVRPPVPELDAIGRFLDDCDLVKFARVEPAPADAVALLGRAESIVRWTTPPQAKPRGPDAPPPPARPSRPGAEARP